MSSSQNNFCAITLLMVLGAAQLSGQEASSKQSGKPLSEKKIITTDWGTIDGPDQNGIYALQIKARPDANKLTIPTPFPNIIAAHFNHDQTTISLAFEFNSDASKISLLLPAKSQVKNSADKNRNRINVLCAEKSKQFPNGTIVLSALDAKVDGDRAKLESHPGNHRIGFWTNSADSITWQHKATRWGKYDVELVYSLAGRNGSEIQTTIGDQKLRKTLLQPTGSWYCYQSIPLGSVYLATSGPRKITVSCTELNDSAVMNLKAIVLRPAFEGDSPAKPDENGNILLHSRTSRVLGTTLRYEPRKIKNTLGYWSNPGDQAEWALVVNKKSTFRVEVFQGCGTGQGGSHVAVLFFQDHHGLDSKDAAITSLEFTVEDTGHFQNFKKRNIGKITMAPGKYRCRVVPVKKAKNAVMDLRQIELITVDQ